MIPYFGRGFTDAEIATLFGFTEHAARSHRQRIMQKLGLHRSIDLMQWAIRMGLAVIPPASRH